MEENVWDINDDWGWKHPERRTDLTHDIVAIDEESTKHCENCKWTTVKTVNPTNLLHYMCYCDVHRPPPSGSCNFSKLSNGHQFDLEEDKEFTVDELVIEADGIEIEVTEDMIEDGKIRLHFDSPVKEIVMKHEKK